jgi:DNA polymerase elongation subunit (family B)
MDARARTRSALKTVPQGDAAAAAVLDARQKALKTMANALYGFTGAQRMHEKECTRCTLTSTSGMGA